jgi:hypothetical protein
LVSSEPPDGAEAVALGPFEVRLRFAAPLAAPEKDAHSRIQQACNAYALDEAVSARLGDDARELVIAIDGTLPDSEHALVVPSGFLDADGLPLPSQRIRFTTRPTDPASRPRIVATHPANGARDVPCDLDRIRVEFSEPMRPGSGFKTPRIAAMARDGWAKPPLEGYAVWEDDRTAWWKLGQRLEPGKGYGLPFDVNYRDLEGQDMVGFELTFTTAKD